MKNFKVLLLIDWASLDHEFYWQVAARRQKGSPTGRHPPRSWLRTITVQVRIAPRALQIHSLEPSMNFETLETVRHLTLNTLSPVFIQPQATSNTSTRPRTEILGCSQVSIRPAKRTSRFIIVKYSLYTCRVHRIHSSTLKDHDFPSSARLPTPDSLQTSVHTLDHDADVWK